MQLDQLGEARRSPDDWSVEKQSSLGAIAIRVERNDVSAVVGQLKVWCGLPDRQSWAEIPGGDHPLRASRGQRSSEAIFIGELLATHGSKCSDFS